MIKKESSGFSAVEALLILVAVAIIGFTGWFVWQSSKTTDKTLSDGNRSAAAPAVAKKKVTTTKQLSSTTDAASTDNVPITASKAVDMVNTVYAKYIAALKAGNSRQEALAGVKSYFDSSTYNTLYNTTTTYDPLTCYDQIPNTEAASLYDSNNGKANIIVTDASLQQGAAEIYVNLSNAKISSHSCPN